MGLRKHLLLVDDIKLFLELEKTFFHRENFQITVACNGEQALKFIQTKHPDLVVMDLHMPVMDGAVCCRRIKNDPDLKEIPVILIAGGREDLPRCREAGCDEVVAKPLNRRSLLGTVRKFLKIADRASPRARTRVLVHYGIESQKTLHDYSVNLGPGGLFLEMELPLPVGTPLTLEFFVPGANETINCKGRVAWVNPPQSKTKPDFPAGIGVEFTDLPPRDVLSIQEFVRAECLSPA